MNESPFLIHMWEVDPAQEGAAVQHLDEMFGEIAQDPGFVSARVLQSDDHTSLAAIVEMRSPRTANAYSSRPRSQRRSATSTARRISSSGSITRWRSTTRVDPLPQSLTKAA